MKNIIKGLSDSKRMEISEMLNRAFEEVYQSGFADGQASTVEDTAVETIEHEGKYLQKVDREYKDDDYVRVQHSNGYCFKPNKLYGPVKDGVVKAESSFGEDDYEIADVYNYFYGRDESTVEVFEVVTQVVDEPAPVTANQQRAELIQRAREFKDNLIDEIHGYYLIIAKSGEKYLCDAVFKHNHMKRTTTCILVGAGTGYTRKKAVVHCHPNEVFNEPIGEVISLCKALQIDIPQEFLDAVQPDEVVVGMMVGPLNEDWEAFEVAEIKESGSELYDEEGTWIDTIWSKIIDDTNAEYGEVEAL